MKQETRMSTASRETSAPMLTYARGRFGYTPYARGRFDTGDTWRASIARIPHMHVGGLEPSALVRAAEIAEAKEGGNE